MSDRPLGDIQECADGTAFVVMSEHIRGEPRFYWVERRVGLHQYRHTDYQGGEDRRSAQRAARRLADQHDKENG